MDKPSEERVETVRVAAGEWIKRLIDLGPRNTLLHFKNTKLGSLDLTSSDPRALQGLLTGTATRLGALLTDEAQQQDACLRARSLHRRILMFQEEQGVDVGKIAHGLVTTAPAKTPGISPIRPLRAPLLLRSVTIAPRTVTESDFSLQVSDDVEVNPVLLHALDQQYGLDIDVDAFVDVVESTLVQERNPEDQLSCVYELLADTTTAQDLAIALEPAIVIGLFNYEKLPMVNDLRRATELLAGHDIVASLAGHRDATDTLAFESGEFDAPRPDDIAPSKEYLVQDADSSQHRAIVTALSGRNVLIEGPPGTGKSQTIANIIAGAAACGKRVLFVAEKRAAIEAVTDRLAAVGLVDLVFDLHQQKVNKKQVAKQLQDSLEATARQLPFAASELHSRLVMHRNHLSAYSQELHAQRDPWHVSAFQVQVELLQMPSGGRPFTFRGSTLRALDRATVSGLEQDLQAFIEAGGLRVVRRESPWSQATVRDEADIERVIAELDELTTRTLRDGRASMARVLASTGLSHPDDLMQWRQVLDLLDDVHHTTEQLGSQVFGPNLDDWWAATGSRAVRAAHPARLPWSRRRALVKQVRAASRSGVKKKRALHVQLSVARQQRERWRELGGSEVQPADLSGLQDAMATYQTVKSQLASVALCVQLPDLEHRPTDDVDRALEALNSDRATLWQMPKITQRIANFRRLGLLDLLEDAAEQNLTGEQLWLSFRRSWLYSLIDEFKLRVPALREFVGDQHDRRVREFQEADTEHRATSAQRVRWAVAKALRQVRDEYPAETRVLRDQANRKSRHLPLRRLVERTSHVMLALRPCWAMSPLVVSKTLPAERLFDLVIFDEASQIPPHEAITSIARGNSLVIAGDDKQLPPTTFFTRMLDGSEEADDEEAGGLRDFESILTVMRSRLDQTRLRWHYRSQDERLIAFSNREIYADDLVTFPGATRETPVRLEVVDGVASPGQDGSSPAEIERVVQIVLEHAATHPDESLGVIAMSQKHADRVDRAIREALRDRPELEDFFDEDAGPGKRFFVKNLERVQGDERDAIVLTIGVAKRADGRLTRTGFGPLNQEGGRRRLNVAVTRAKRRMTVVSSFYPHDLAPSGEESGTELLRRYVDFAQRHGDLEQVGRPESTPLNGFEEDVYCALTARGVEVHPQWGFSDYRIDFALAHRHHPGRMVLAIETDGDSYHRAHSTRDRDRLRQTHLERLGWRFHRVWASAWFGDRDGETERILKAWERAMVELDEQPSAIVPQPAARLAARVERAARPSVPPGRKINEYTDRELIEVCLWLMSDQLQVDREERIDQARRELGFQRRGARIAERLRTAVNVAQDYVDKENL